MIESLPVLKQKEHAHQPYSPPPPLTIFSPKRLACGAAPRVLGTFLGSTLLALPLVVAATGEGPPESASFMDFVRVPAGSFLMGSPRDEEGHHPNESQHARSVDEFWLGKHEVTQGQWEAVMGANPSDFAACGRDCPVERVSWEDVQEFIGKLNEREDGYEYRLPTEAEWEYAARAAANGSRYGQLDEIAWWSGNSDERTHPVGGKAANAWGLHDMFGNVAEWTADWYQSYPDAERAFDRTGSSRVHRGGSWTSIAPYLRFADRSIETLDSRGNAIGFRLVRTEVEPVD